MSSVDPNVAVNDQDPLLESTYSSSESPLPPADSRRTLGTWAGVFAPVSMSMFSTLLFLRVGYIVGNSGIWGSLAILALAYTILLLTVASINAIATNGRVETGGVYFMISRTLGPEIGTVVGLLFYSANVVASALYAVGLSEGLVGYFGYDTATFIELIPSSFWYQFLYASIVNLLNVVVTLTGAGVFGKLTVAALIGIVFFISELVVSFMSKESFTMQYNTTFPNCTVNCSYHTVNGTFHGLAGQSFSELSQRFQENNFFTFYQDCEDHFEPVTFSSLFGVLFSGVTGIMAGANLSGELKKPSESIPRGTYFGCIFTFCIYAVLFLLTGLTCNRDLLYNNCQYMSDVSLLTFCVVFGALVTTGMASTSTLIGGSRILQAVANDNLLGPLSRVFVKGTTKNGNPYAAVLVTWFLIQCLFFVGSLNKIAVISTVLFLVSYFAVNMSSFLLDWAAAPNFRPLHHTHWVYSLIAALLVLAVISWVNTAFGCGALAISFAMILFCHYFLPRNEIDWGSISQGLLFHQVRKYLLRLDVRKAHVKFWRPQILLLLSNPNSLKNVTLFGNALKKGGLFILGHVYQSDLDSLVNDPTVPAFKKWLDLIDSLEVKAFPELTVTPKIRQGIQSLVHISGIGAMKPNTVMIGFRSSGDYLGQSNPQLDEEIENVFQYNEGSFERSQVSVREYCAILRDIVKMEKNLCIFRHFEKLNLDSVPQSFNCIHKKLFPTWHSYRKRVYFDLWLFDFFTRQDSVRKYINDNCVSFICQLSYLVVHSKWREVILRSNIPKQGGSNSEALVKKLNDFLEKSRIQSLVREVDFDTSEIEPKPELDEGGIRYKLESISDHYMTLMNQTIRNHCSDGGGEETLACFIYMGKPPKVEEEEKHLHLLDLLSRDLPPTIFMHGISSVISSSI